MTNFTKDKYEAPEITVTRFEVMDVIRASSETFEGDAWEAEQFAD